jgi:hypothetical protein
MLDDPNKLAMPEAREALELQKSYLIIISGREPQKIRTRQVRPRKSKGMSR